MGMFIIDTFQFLDPTTGQDLGSKGLEDQIGGGGCYSRIGRGLSGRAQGRRRPGGA